MKNIILDCERMKYQDTGLYHYCVNLASHLQKNADPGREQFTFYCPKSAIQYLTHSQKPVLQHSFHKFLLPQTLNYDIWHATYQNSFYLPQRNKKIKVILSIHDLNFLYDEKKSAAKKQKHLRHLQKNINRSDAIICISEFCKKDVLTYCDISSKPIHLIHNGTNVLTQPYLTPQSYKPLKKFLFSIGVVTRKKNFHALLPLLNNNEMELLIAGRCDDQDYVNFLIESATKMGVEKNLHILGMISETEKSWYYENCYAFASTSLAEGFCMPVTEAMSVGKPLFLSNKTALPEIGGKVAFYFPDFESNNMQNVFLKGMEHYAGSDMHQAIKERGSNFCWDKAALQYLEVYRNL